MTETSKKIWTKLEENIGRCILFRDAALKEVLGNDTFMLQFATLSVPEKVEAFLDNAEEVSIIRREKIYYVFSWEGARVEIYCFDAESGFESSYEKMFSRPLRCENLGINIMGQYNRNVDAYNDIVAKELHFASGEAKITEFLVSKIVRYVLNFGFTIGEDILENASQNKIFDSKAMRVRFLSALSDNIKKTTCTWDRVAEVLKFIAELLPSPDFIQYTTALGDMEKDDKFVRNYLYNLFIILDMTGQELHKIIPKESTLEYFDSLAINIGACLLFKKDTMDPSSEIIAVAAWGAVPGQNCSIDMREMTMDCKGRFCVCVCNIRPKEKDGKIYNNYDLRYIIKSPKPKEVA